MITISVAFDGVRENSDLKQFVNLALRLASTLLKVDHVEMSLVYTNASKMRKLNAHFRGVNKPTDVLSFAMREADPFPFPSKKENEYLGHIVLNVDDLRVRAKKEKTTMKRLARFLSVHGLLHLLGYDHATKKDVELMRSLERLLTKGDVYYEDTL